MKHGEAGSVLSRLAEHPVTVDAHSGFLGNWNATIRAGPMSAPLAPSIAPVGHKEHSHTGQDRGWREWAR
jgi:hypothetical protein